MNRVSLAAACLTILAATHASAQSGANVLLVVNEELPASIQIGDYYANVRSVPPNQILRLELEVADEIERTVFNAKIEANSLADGPPLAMQMSKQLLNAGLTSSLQEALNAEAMAQSVHFASEDTREAVTAFFRKTTAKFRGV